MTADSTLPASDSLTPEVLARWEELAAKATEGPWNAKGYTDFPEDEGCGITAGLEGTMEERGIAYAVEYSWTTPESCTADAEFIAECRTAVPALLSGVRSRDARIAELEGVIARALAEADDWSKSPPGESAPTRAVGDLFADILRPGAKEPRMSALDLITGDRGEAVITWQMQMSEGYPGNARALEMVINTQFPHLQFWVGKRITDGALTIEWEPRT